MSQLVLKQENFQMLPKTKQLKTKSHILKI
jgi:hypothetical protein